MIEDARSPSAAHPDSPDEDRHLLHRPPHGHRPPVAAPAFGLSPNATAALARRARDGLRAAYLQAHVAEGHGAQGCRPVLDKLGAYTAGGVKGAEARRIRGHLAGCRSCRSLHDELREVCAELRTCVGAMALPATAFAVSQQLMGAGAAPATPAGG